MNSFNQAKTYYVNILSKQQTEKNNGTQTHPIGK